MVEPKRIFEKYFDAHYQRPYYFDVATQESLWELPDEPDLEIVDKTKDEALDEKAKQLADIEAFKKRMLQLEAEE
jgi:hypothetical protein